MAATDEISDRLEEFKVSGLIADYELLILDEGVRVRIVAPPGQDGASVKSFIVDAFAGVLSHSQIALEEAEA